MKWQTPVGMEFRTRVDRLLAPVGSAAVYDLVLTGLEPKTASNYGAGLLRFTQFCDELRIPEERRMPAPEYLLVAFLARHAGRVRDGTMESWLAGLQMFHAVNGARWEGARLLQYAKRGARKCNPPGRPKRPPVTLEHMAALLKNLNMGNTFDAAVYAAATTAFWGCRRYV